MSELLVTQAAADEYEESLEWYAERSEKAAKRFEAEVKRGLKAITAHPDRYPQCGKRNRFFLLRRYPFQLIYRAINSSQVLLVAVAHTSRQPDYWENR